MQTNNLGKARLLACIGIVLIAGFLATSLSSYYTSRESIRLRISSKGLPLTSDNIYSEIQHDLLRPVLIAAQMANDTFLRNWVLEGERRPEQIKQFLQEVKSRYGAVSAFLVSENSRHYYYAGGVLKDVAEGEARDKWYFRLRGIAGDYETNVDPDLANRDAITIFINHKVLDFKGNFIGATGIGLTLDAVSHIVDNYQQRFNRRIYFVDRSGQIVLASKSLYLLRGSIRELPGIREVADKVMAAGNEPEAMHYPFRGSTIWLNARFIPELGWYLLVEEDESGEISAIRNALLLNILISTCITVVVLAITLYAINRFQRRLERLANYDVLTGLLNRQAFELLIQQSINTAQRYQRPLAAILFDLDHFKTINDTHGHLVGDEVLRQIASVTRSVLRESDAICRWGGEEFLILLSECSQAQALLTAEKLRATIELHDFTAPVKLVTISAGVVQYRQRETAISFFARADEALYRAKANGRNQVELESQPTDRSSEPPKTTINA
ncbi:sensor domain-containing diguanylate cyclase [Uliginosibacterium sediminicola]|uniref:sensor domain-containing diguanylate cyclase n=1 Tax=Uliginosibacterium sediminicola TaxID=2024550 RepID=UPI0031F69AD6